MLLDLGELMLGLCLACVDTVDVKQLFDLGICWDVLEFIQLQDLLLHLFAQSHYYLPIVLHCLLKVSVLLPIFLSLYLAN